MVHCVDAASRNNHTGRATGPDTPGRWPAVDIPQINAGRTNIMNYTFTEENNYLQRVASAAAKS